MIGMTRRTLVAFAAILLLAPLAGNARAEKIPYANSKIKPPTPEWTAKIQEACSRKADGRCRQAEGARVLALHRFQA